MNNENKNLSRSRRIERKIEMIDNMKLLLNKFQSEKNEE